MDRPLEVGDIVRMVWLERLTEEQKIDAATVYGSDPLEVRMVVGGHACQVRRIRDGAHTNINYVVQRFKIDHFLMAARKVKNEQSKS